jgi:hypothetical protein
MRLKIRCDGWKRKYFGYACEVNGPQVTMGLIGCKGSIEPGWLGCARPNESG